MRNTRRDARALVVLSLYALGQLVQMLESLEARRVVAVAVPGWSVRP